MIPFEGSEERLRSTGEESTYAILRTRCIWDKEQQTTNDNSTDVEEEGVWDVVLANHNIQCDVIFDAGFDPVKGSTEGDGDTAAINVMDNIVVRSGVRLNRCGQHDNVWVHPSRPSALQLNFVACYLQVEMNESDTLLRLPVIPQPWEITWSPGHGATLLSVAMNLTQARSIFLETLHPIEEPEEEELLEMMNDPEFLLYDNSTATCLQFPEDTAAPTPPNDDVAWSDLKAKMDREMQGINHLLIIHALIAGAAVCYLVRCWWLTGERDQTAKQARGLKGASIKPKESSVASSPLSRSNPDSTRCELLETEWKNSHAERRRKPSKQAQPKRFRIPVEEFFGEAKTGDDSNTAACARPTLPSSLAAATKTRAPSLSSNHTQAPEDTVLLIQNTWGL